MHNNCIEELSPLGSKTAILIAEPALVDRMQQLTATYGTIDLSALTPAPVRVDWCGEVFDTASAAAECSASAEVCKNAVAYLVTGQHIATVSSRSEQSWCCRWLLYLLLQQLHPDKGNYWAVGHNRYGAPQLLLNNAPCIYRLSFSHSGPYCAVALSRETSVGIDIERCGTGRDFAAMSQFLGWQAEYGQETRFLDCWTLHEACIKVSERSVLPAPIPGFDELNRMAQPGQLSSSGSWQVLQWHLIRREHTIEPPAHFSSHTTSAQLSCVLRSNPPRPLAFRHFDWRGSCGDASMDSASRDVAVSA